MNIAHAEMLLKTWYYEYARTTKYIKLHVIKVQCIINFIRQIIRFLLPNLEACQQGTPWSPNLVPSIELRRVVPEP